MNEFKAAVINAGELSDVPLSNTLTSACMCAGYRVSNFHKDPLAIKTDAPNSVLWDIIRAHHKL